MIDKIIDKYHYTIDDNNTVRVWLTEENILSNPPFFYQPDHPDGRPWINTEEAQSWIDDLISRWLTPEPEQQTNIEE